MEELVTKVETKEQLNQLSNLVSTIRLNPASLVHLKEHINNSLYIYITIPNWDWSWDNFYDEQHESNCTFIPIEELLNFPQTNPEYFI